VLADVRAGHVSRAAARSDYAMDDALLATLDAPTGAGSG
jgi:hypothetical protein